MTIANNILKNVNVFWSCKLAGQPQEEETFAMHRCVVLVGDLEGQ